MRGFRGGCQVTIQYVQFPLYDLPVACGQVRFVPYSSRGLRPTVPQPSSGGWGEDALPAIYCAYLRIPAEA